MKYALVVLVLALGACSTNTPVAPEPVAAPTSSADEALASAFVGHNGTPPGPGDCSLGRRCCYDRGGRLHCR